MSGNTVSHRSKFASLNETFSVIFKHCAMGVHKGKSTFSNLATNEGNQRFLKKTCAVLLSNPQFGSFGRFLQNMKKKLTKKTAIKNGLP